MNAEYLRMPFKTSRNHGIHQTSHPPVDFWLPPWTITSAAASFLGCAVTLSIVPWLVFVDCAVTFSVVPWLSRLCRKIGGHAVGFIVAPCQDSYFCRDTCGPPYLSDDWPTLSHFHRWERATSSPLLLGHASFPLATHHNGHNLTPRVEQGGTNHRVGSFEQKFALSEKPRKIRYVFVALEFRHSNLEMLLRVMQNFVS